MKGLFTQGAALLVDQAVDLTDLEPLTRDFGQAHYVPASDEWAFAERTLLIPMEDREHGGFAIDFVSRPWPDDMGDPKITPTLFAAWSMGHFGPLTFPGCLGRACQHAWEQPEIQAKPPKHRGFIRVRTSYGYGAADSDPVFPLDYEALPELEKITELVQMLLRHPAVRFYFNPGGETILSPKRLAELLTWSDQQNLPALQAWSNVRFFNLDGVANGWFLLDTVGMWQLDVPDHEAFVPGDRYDFNEVDEFLRNAALYVLTNGPVIKDGDTMDGPGNIRWQGKTYTESFIDPPREVLRWFPVDGTKPPEQLLAVRKRARA